VISLSRESSKNMDTLTETVGQENFSGEDLDKEESALNFVPEWLTNKLIEDALKNFFKNEEIQVNFYINIF
jgi:hypothetical protein